MLRVDYVNQNKVNTNLVYPSKLNFIPYGNQFHMFIDNYDS